MNLYTKRNSILRDIFIIIIGLAIVFFIDYLGFFEGLNNYLYDLSFRLRGPVKHDERILIAAIDEKTLAELGRWPLRRFYYSNLIDSVGEASVVGFDIVFSEPSPDDISFSNSIKRFGRVVLPVYISEFTGVSKPLEIFSPVGLGHIHVELGADGIVRKVFNRIIHNDETLYSFSYVVYGVFTGKELGI